MTDARIRLLVEADQKRLISQAAALSGQTVTQYVLGLVLPDAESRVENRGVMKRMDAPSKELPALRALFRREGRFKET